MPGLWAAEPVDWLWVGRYVITMDAQRRVFEDGAVAVRGERIVAVGPRAELQRRFRPRQRLGGPNRLIAPGLVNAHTHAAMSLLRGIAADLRLQDWLERYIFPAEAKLVRADFVRWGTRLACLEMALGGITTYADMYYFEEVVAEATAEAGLRGVLGETILQFPAPDAATPEEALAYTERFLRRFRGHPLIVAAVAPHALYTNRDETLQAARDLADRYDAPLLIHLAETRQEREEILARRKATPVAVLDSLGVLRGRTLAAHAVWVDESDLRILQARRVAVAHCPSSNMKLASGIAPVMRMVELGIAVGLGTDGPAGSNDDLSLFEEMDLAAKLQKVATGNPEALPAARVLEMATIQGARALGLDQHIGSLEAGKRADVISVRLDAPHATPLYDPVSQLVYALKSTDVEDVMVNGRLLVRGRRMLTLNPDEVLARAAQFSASVREAVKPLR
ncbi:MAG: amidohydrolase family protein [Bryobacteraceae bacterium]|nr:amidohydrolase family protein [Bryobacteraceae bacterium]